MSPVSTTFSLIVLAVAFVGCDGSADIAAPASRPSAEVDRPSSMRAVSQKLAQNPPDIPMTLVASRGIAFHDVAQEMHLEHSWPEQPRPMTSLEAFGVGCVSFDGDNDGWQEVLLVGQPNPRLLHNLRGVSFDDVTTGSGLENQLGDWRGCAVGDYNGDGLFDILLTGYHRLALYKNLGSLKFDDVTTDVGLDPSNLGEWGSSAGFMDLDGDQWLDLVILNYVVFGADSPQYCEHHGIRSGCNPRVTYPPERGRIWRNSGSGRFELIPQSQGMESTHGMALVVAFMDLDEDGRVDMYIGNDGLPADLLHNLGGMRFENIARVAGVEQVEIGAVAAMGVDWADFDRDGNLDLAVTNWQGLGAVLFRKLDSGLFVDQSQITGLTRITKFSMGFGAKWIDFENDGWPDLFLVNGHVYDNSALVEGPSARFRQPVNLLSNDRGEKFVDIVSALNEDVQRTMVGRGSATGDFDNDGRIDLLAVDLEGPVMLLRNETEMRNHWLTLDLRGAFPNVFGYGARVTARAGAKLWRAELSPASSYLSSSDPRIHWGLGDVTSLDSMTIRWSTGIEQTLTDVPVDQILRIVEPKASSPAGTGK